MRNEKGDFIYGQKNDGFRFVLRKEINKDFEIEHIVDPNLKKMIFNQLNGRSVDKTLKEDGGLWMLDRNGTRINKIRHVRCFADDVTNPLAIKKQTAVSHKDYKNEYWAKSGENYICALYQNVKKDKDGSIEIKYGKEVFEREIEIVNLMDVSVIGKLNDTDDLPIFRKNKNGLDILRENGKKETPFAILKRGTKVIFYRENIEELKDLMQWELSSRIYKVKKFAGSRITFDFHLEAREDDKLTKAFQEKGFFKRDEKGKEITFGKRGKNGFTEEFFDYENLNHGNPWHRLLYSKDYFDFAVEGKHFKVNPDGTIEWYL